MFHTLVTRGAVVLGDVFPKSLYHGIGESHFVVYAVMGDRLLQRLGYDNARAIVFALFVIRGHVLQQELVWALYTQGRYLCVCGDGSMRLCECACKCLVGSDA